MRHLSLLFFVFWLGAAKANEPLTIAAASDLRYALNDVIALYQTEQPDAQLRVTYGSSGKMTTQIRHGAPFDLFFSADIQFPEQLYAEGHAVTKPTLYAIGRIVLWSPRLDLTEVTLSQLNELNFRRLAIAQPAHAPYGLRAKEALQTSGVWDAVEPKLVYGENIAQTAQMAQSGAAEVAIIALSLARFPELARHGYQLIPAELHQPLTQAYTITRHGADKAAAQQFADFMTTPAALAIMQHYGFELPVTQPATQRVAEKAGNEG
ncbi:molybdate ABC transporter substrate-binding protein [Alkalimonas amylolytica]|uniref:Molybdate transport system substrate-binding protein n=1 Tax=Alkalimonas amylolytica TaxID=152573 RepID=A0A1H3ZNS9_ALKAM|nr:molybdate ABC transporter substrate-binding protein [Alkalimonas amylolytica]SEA25288.1 molybdate transport system substrate-binding protein [Alkalimonas amylolytica]